MQTNKLFIRSNKPLFNMNRERNLKKLQESLYETQDTLTDLIEETRSELGKQLEGTRSDVSKRFQTTEKRLGKRYGEARKHLEKTLGESTKEAEKLYKSSRKDAEKLYASSRKDAGKFYEGTKKEAEKTYDRTRADLLGRYSEARVEANKKLAELRKVANERGDKLRLRTADLLQGLSAGLLAARNRLEPNKRLALRDEKEKHHLGKGGGFKRFIAIAIMIVAKKDMILSLGQQLYNKLQDGEARQAVKDDAREQFDTMRRLMKAYANGHYREFPYTSIVKIVAAVVYFVSVVDLIPDFIPILGLTDDLAILAWVYSSVKDDMQKFVDWEEANERRREKMEGQKSPARATASAADRTAASPETARTAAANQAPTTVGTTGGTGAERAGTTGTAASSGNTNTTNTNKVPATGGSINSSGGTGTTGGGTTAGGGTSSATGRTGTSTNNKNAKE